MKTEITDNQNTPASGSDAPTCSAWTPITEKMPQVGRKVLVCGHYRNGNRWIACARWQPAKTIDAEMWDECPDDWEDEDGDTITNPHDLWLEESVELETTGFLENVTHWMEKPDLPNDDEWLLKNYLPNVEWWHRRWEARIQFGTLSPVATHGLFASSDSGEKQRDQSPN
jgi:hypothetical protein